MTFNSVKNVPPANDKIGPKFGTTIAMTTMISIKDVRMVMRCQLKSKMKKKMESNHARSIEETQQIFWLSKST